MFGKRFVNTLITRSAENDVDRRRFLKAAGLGGLGVVGASVIGPSAVAAASGSSQPSDYAILNFALNLEYLEAEFYSYAVTGHGLAYEMTTGRQERGGVTGGSAVPFESASARQHAQEIYEDERHHVAFLRQTLGSAKVSQPAIDLKNSFTAAAQAAGLIGLHQTFNPFSSQNNFLLGAFIFEDVGVTAYKGAAPLITNKMYLEAAAGILAVEAYHAATIRQQLLERGLGDSARKISNARDSLDGATDDDQGVTLGGQVNIVPSDRNGIAYSRSADRVLNIVYLNPKKTTTGGFFPAGVNGSINTSGGTRS